MLKKVVKSVGAFIIISLVFAVILGIPGYIEHNYKREGCEVVWIDDGKVTVQDKAGLRWRFDDDGTYQEGDVVTLKMHTNFTSPVGDDTIKEVIR